MSARNRIRVDVAIIGGGSTGLWLLNRLRTHGYSVVLFERSAFGAGQTIASQGTIHGGMKYALRGALTKTSEALAAMPQRWSECLHGDGDVDLRGVKVLSDHYYMWANESELGQLGAFFTNKGLRGRIRQLDRADFPRPFDAPDFGGVVYELNDIVIDTASLLATLVARQRPYVLRCHVRSPQLLRDTGGSIAGIQIDDADVTAKRYVLAAGTGNHGLLEALGITDVSMQRRPLRQVIVRGHRLVPLYAHCIQGITDGEPRLTITTHTESDGRLLWYVGGQLANEGVARSAAVQIVHARKELTACLPWLDLTDIDLETVWLERAEPAQTDQQRPDGAFVARVSNLLVCWPTKLALVPALADQVLAALDVTPTGPALPLSGATDLAVAAAPWER